MWFLAFAYVRYPDWFFGFFDVRETESEWGGRDGSGGSPQAGPRPRPARARRVARPARRRALHRAHAAARRSGEYCPPARRAQVPCAFVFGPPYCSSYTAAGRDSSRLWELLMRGSREILGIILTKSARGPSPLHGAGGDLGGTRVEASCGRRGEGFAPFETRHQ